MAVEFRILGTTEVVVDGVTVPVGPFRQQCVLVALLVNLNRPMPVEHLVDRVWNGTAPAEARTSLRSYLSRLRRIADLRIERRAGSYLLLADPASVDLHRFRALVATARGLGDRDEALAAYDRALALWRGEPLAGLDFPWAVTLRRTVEAERHAARLDRGDLRLRRGEHAEVLPELAEHLAENPLDERLAGQYLLALYRCGRQAEALAHYERLRARLADELGIDPGPRLRELHRRILTATAELDTIGALLPVPQQLPAAVPGFVGRVRALKELDVAVSVISGMAGVGKTALAIEWAHRVRARFPDGQLYVNLRGYGPGPPLRPFEALTRFLRSLGVAADQLPTEPDEAAALLRTLLADRKALVLLDNAATPEQVRPLLPGGAGSVVLVTSRDRLDGLVACDGARRLTLDVLTEDEAIRLLAGVLGAERVAAEPEAAAELVRLTARLPLALRIAAAKLTGSIAGHVDQLRSGDKLGQLEIAGDERAALRSTFGISYRSLSTEQQRLFRLLGLFPGEDFTPEAVAELAGTGRAAELLDDLATAHLLDPHRPGRYTFHDLLRQYAAERCRSEDSEQDRKAALDRLAYWYFRTADAAAKVLHPQLLRLPDAPFSGAAPDFPDRATALSWLDSERANIAAVGAATAEHGPREVAWRLADTLRGYFWTGLHHPEWSTSAAAAVKAAAVEGDVRANAVVLINLGDSCLRRSEHERAAEHYTRAVGLLRDASWADGQATVLGKLGLVHRESGDLARAADCYERAFEAAGSKVRQAACLGNLGFVQYEMGEYARAATGHARALALYEELGIESGQATALGNLGDALHALGRSGEAMARFDRALPILREIGDVSTEAATLASMAAVDLDTGRDQRAAERARAAVDLARRSGDARVEVDALTALGWVHQASGRTAEAADCHRQALDLGRHAGLRYNAAEALVGLAVARADRDTAREALELVREAGYRGLEGRVLTALAELLLHEGETAQAAEHGQRALAIHRETGHRRGEARTLALLARTY
ncbi:BTAD domain-containing putative transcriptional regulator [Amycolatopsis sp. YIM 10]|uniref:AfsR/SARP family transcriptional regulator n=1 Tax=Amycolatopsis sp. YIM 10 TaxID=2653857 RepID=UPI00128FD61E|nr:BTAD domain-containing putative transcriptional regulator [Amycolatopsis sp. YIM 10]QFU92055.1 Regulatory protein AfsR [Amycolatopsis sp. YIM 10]